MHYKFLFYCRIHNISLHTLQHQGIKVRNQLTANKKLTLCINYPENLGIEIFVSSAWNSRIIQLFFFFFNIEYPEWYFWTVSNFISIFLSIAGKNYLHKIICEGPWMQKGSHRFKEKLSSEIPWGLLVM